MGGKEQDPCDFWGHLPRRYGIEHLTSRRRADDVETLHGNFLAWKRFEGFLKVHC